MREWTNDGVELPAGDVADYTLSMYTFANDAQMMIAKRRKIPSSYEIVQNRPINLLGDVVGGATYTFEGDDLIFEYAGGRSFFLEVYGAGTIYIEEETSADTWEELDSIEFDVSAWTAYKGQITPADTDNSIRIRISGTYRFHIRYLSLYALPYADDTDIPGGGPYCEYSLPSDFWKLDKVVAIDIYGNSSTFASFDWKKRKTVTVDKDFQGTIDFQYFKTPTQFTEDSLDTTELEIDADLQYMVPMYMAAQSLSDENITLSVQKLNEFYVLLNGIQEADDPGFQSIINTKGW